MTTRSFKLMLGAGLAFLTSACLWTIPAEETNPYLSISERNPFGLKPPPPPQPDAPPPPPPAAPAATIKLTGITSIIGPPKALFEIVEPGPGKTPRKPILSEKERDGDLEVVAINIEKGEVTIRNAGVLTNITFAPLETAAAAPAAPARPGAPVLPPSRGGTTAVPPAAQEGPLIVSRGGANPNPSRSSVTVLGGAAQAAPSLPQSTSRVGPTYNAATTAAQAANRLRSIPSRTIRTNPQETDSAGQAPPAMNKEQLRQWLEAQREVYRQTGDPKAAIVPPQPQ